MRQKNLRVAATGAGLIVLAAIFFLWMWVSLAAKSTDPIGLMQTVGTVSGVGVGLGLAMVVFGMIGKRRA